jgi:hypothetical protein
MSRNPFLGLVLVILSTATMLWAQTPQVVAIRAGHLFDSKSVQMLNNQVVLIEGEKISEVGATDRVEIPSEDRPQPGDGSARFGRRAYPCFQQFSGGCWRNYINRGLDTRRLEKRSNRSTGERVKFVMKGGQVVRNDLK